MSSLLVPVILRGLADPLPNVRLTAARVADDILSVAAMSSWPAPGGRRGAAFSGGNGNDTGSGTGCGSIVIGVTGNEGPCNAVGAAGGGVSGGVFSLENRGFVPAVVECDANSVRPARGDVNQGQQAGVEGDNSPVATMGAGNCNSFVDGSGPAAVSSTTTTTATGGGSCLPAHDDDDYDSNDEDGNEDGSYDDGGDYDDAARLSGCIDSTGGDDEKTYPSLAGLPKGAAPPHLQQQQRRQQRLDTSGGSNADKASGSAEVMGEEESARCRPGEARAEWWGCGWEEVELRLEKLSGEDADRDVSYYATQALKPKWVGDARRGRFLVGP